MVVVKDPIPVEPEAQLHDHTEEERERIQERAQRGGSLAMSPVEDYIDRELLEIFEFLFQIGRGHRFRTAEEELTPASADLFQPIRVKRRVLFPPRRRQNTADFDRGALTN